MYLFIGICLLIFLTYQLYLNYYLNSDKFQSLKDSIIINTQKCNELNHHIIELHSTNLGTKNIEYGDATLKDISNFNFKRKEWNKIKNDNFIHECSLSICKNAKVQPFKYLCKYFNIKPTEDSLEKVEKMLNNFLALEEGKKLLINERERIYLSIENNIPFLISSLSKNKIIEKLGFEKLEFNKLKFPQYTFQYTSSGGNSSTKCEIILDINNLEKFILYLEEIVKFRKSIAGQRALMTQKLRNIIKMRDNYTCQCCGNSIYKEPNLLLEIDHIIPISKGGVTSEENLQTLCWKCNRKKSNK